MGTNCAPLVADLFLFCCERDFMMSLFDDAFNTTSRYLDDILNISNVYFDNIVTMSNVRNIKISEGCVYAQIRRG